jgi:two-component system, LuxR family, sensor histidine kinase TtrS
MEAARSACFSALKEKMLQYNNLSFFLTAATCLLLAAFGSAPAKAAEYTIGVLAKSGDVKAISQWSAHGDYLSEATGDSFSVVPVTFAAMDKTIREKKVDFFLANPAIFIEMREQHGAVALATMINSVHGKSVHQFGGVIFVRKDSPIMTLNDIKGKRFGFVKKTSFGGLHAALYLLKTNGGIDPSRDCSAYAEIGTHEKVVAAVADGAVDVGTVRTDTLERMAEDGKIKLDDFRILNQVKDDFPFVHSTILYPEWPLAVLPHVDKKVGEKVAAALHDMKADAAAAKDAKITGWKSAVDYTPVLECLRTIGVSGGE